MHNLTFEELEIISAVGGSRKNVIARLTKILENTDEEYGILEVLKSTIDKLKSMTDSDFDALDLTETEGYYAE